MYRDTRLPEPKVVTHYTPLEMMEFVKAAISEHMEELHKKWLEQRNDPLADYPEVASAKFWAAMKGKSNGQRCSAQAFTKWCRQNGEVRTKNGNYTKATARRWLFG